MVTRRLLAVAAGLGLDRAFGEPPTGLHPVAWFGTAMTACEHRTYAPRRTNGALHAAVGLLAGMGAGRALPRTELSTAGATAIATAGQALGQAATAVGDALQRGDLQQARGLLPSLVGRDPSDLGEIELARAVVESVAENTVDAVIAPALWAVAGGAPGALGYRAINTMDAMVGHRSDRYARFGTPAARLDDFANWVPARVTALLVIAARPAAARAVVRAVRDDAPGHPSPNAGVAEAAFAAALGIQLGGTNRYGDRTEDRVVLGTGRGVERADIAAAVRLSRDCTMVLAALLLAAAAAARWVAA